MSTLRDETWNHKVSPSRYVASFLCVFRLQFFKFWNIIKPSEILSAYCLLAQEGIVKIIYHNFGLWIIFLLGFASYISHNNIICFVVGL
jgi:hypothetical protein